MNVHETIQALTAKGYETMKAVGLQQLSFFDNGVVKGSGIWSDVFCEEMGHKSSGVINRLVEMDLFSVTHDEGVGTNWVELTALGAEVANQIAATEERVAAPAVPQVTTKVGTKWTYIYVDGVLVAEVLTAQADLVKMAL